MARKKKDDVTPPELTKDGAPTPEVDEDGDKAAAPGSGLSDGEIIARKTTDTGEDSTERFLKTFVVGLTTEPKESTGFDHSANKAATVQEAIRVGLRPTGDVALDKSVPQKKGSTVIGWELVYGVDVTLANDVDPAEDPTYVVEPGGSAPANTDNPPKPKA